MKFDLRYVFNNQPLAHGERTFVYLEDGTLCVRTAVQSNSKEQITYTLREVYAAGQVVEPKNTAPMSGAVDMTFTVEPK